LDGLIIFGGDGGGGVVAARTTEDSIETPMIIEKPASPARTEVSFKIFRRLGFCITSS
jgi:hypothetical protein